MIDLYVRDREDGTVHRVGDDHHDHLYVDLNGDLNGIIQYENLLNGAETMCGTFHNEIVEKIGLPACLEQLAEECSELSKAALKLARKQRNDNPTPVTSQEALANLEEEIADVKVCVNLLTDYLRLHNIEYIMDEKVKRWLGRLNQ